MQHDIKQGRQCKNVELLNILFYLRQPDAHLHTPLRRKRPMYIRDSATRLHNVGPDRRPGIEEDSHMQHEIKTVRQCENVELLHNLYYLRQPGAHRQTTPNNTTTMQHRENATRLHHLGPD